MTSCSSALRTFQRVAGSRSSSWTDKAETDPAPLVPHVHGFPSAVNMTKCNPHVPGSLTCPTPRGVASFFTSTYFRARPAGYK